MAVSEVPFIRLSFSCLDLAYGYVKMYDDSCMLCPILLSPQLPAAFDDMNKKRNSVDQVEKAVTISNLDGKKRRKWRKRCLRKALAREEKQEAARRASFRSECDSPLDVIVGCASEPDWNQATRFK